MDMSYALSRCAFRSQALNDDAWCGVSDQARATAVWRRGVQPPVDDMGAWLPTQRIVAEIKLDGEGFRPWFVRNQPPRGFGIVVVHECPR